VADRTAGRHFADARVAPDPAFARENPRRDRGRGGSGTEGRASMNIDEAAFVRDQYATEDRLRARKSAYENAEGDDPRDFAFEAVAEARPSLVLEVGGGEGELAERVQNELGVTMVGVDQSARMVEIQRSKGIDARVGDVQELPF